MAFDGYLQVDGIPGESTDSKHKEWIEIKKYEHHVDQPVSSSASSGGSRASERANHGEFIITKELDKATPKFYLYACNGSNIPSIVLQLCRATGDKQLYMEYELKNVLVSRVEALGDCGADGNLPLERVAFNYDEIRWSYTQLDPKTGSSKGNIESHWNRGDNAGG